MDRPEGKQMVVQYAIEGRSFCIVTFLVGSVDHLYTEISTGHTSYHQKT